MELLFITYYIDNNFIYLAAGTMEGLPFTYLELIQKGKKRLQDFSPSITAQKTLEVYKSVV